jgi:hypothetical protein
MSFGAGTRRTWSKHNYREAVHGDHDGNPSGHVLMVVQQP